MSAVFIDAFRADGTVMNLADLRVEDIDFARMADGLAKIARWNGAYRCASFPVAQHSVMGADALWRETANQILAAYFLLHDGHEYIIGDQTRPAIRLISHHAEKMIAGGAPMVRLAVAAMKADIDAVIHRAAKLPPIAEFPDYARLVADMDERMLRAEGIALFGPKAAAHLPAADLPAPRFSGAIRPWGRMTAELAFIDRLEKYAGIKVRPDNGGAGARRGRG